jgi:hypothetical protein
MKLNYSIFRICYQKKTPHKMSCKRQYHSRPRSFIDEDEAFIFK